MSNEPSQRDIQRVSLAVALAERVVRQWDEHDRFRAVPGEFDASMLEPHGVIIARKLIELAKQKQGEST